MQYGESKRDYFKAVTRDAIKQLAKGQEVIVFSEEQYKTIKMKIECKMCYTKDGFILLTPLGKKKITKIKKGIEVTNKNTNEIKVFKAESKASIYMGKSKSYIGWRKFKMLPSENKEYRWTEIYI